MSLETATAARQPLARPLEDGEAVQLAQLVLKLNLSQDLAQLVEDETAIQVVTAQIRLCIDAMGQSFIDDVRAYSHEQHRYDNLAQLFIEKVLLDIIDYGSGADIQIDEEKFKQKLKEYQKILEQFTAADQRLSSDKKNLDYVGLLNLRIDLPQHYMLTESDVSYALKKLAGGTRNNRIPFQLEKNGKKIFVTNPAEMGIESAQGQSLFGVLKSVEEFYQIRNIVEEYTIYVPLNLGNRHWIYLEIKKNTDDGTITLDSFDSFPVNQKSTSTNSHKNWLAEQCKQFYGPNFEIDNVEMHGSTDQKDGSSCGFLAVRGIVGKINSEHELSKTPVSSITSIRRQVLSAISQQATFEGKLGNTPTPATPTPTPTNTAKVITPTTAPAPAKTAVTYNNSSAPTMFNSRNNKSLQAKPSTFNNSNSKSSQENALLIDVQMQEKIKQGLSSDKDKRFKVKGTLDKWPVTVNYITAENTACPATIDKITNNNKSYLSWKVKSDDIQAWKDSLDAIFAMGADSIEEIRMPNKAMKAELLEYCRDQNYTVKNAPQQASAPKSRLN